VCSRRLAKRRDPGLGIEEAREQIMVGLFGSCFLVSLGFYGVSSLLSGEIRIDSLASLLSSLIIAATIAVWAGLCLLAVVIGIYTLFRRRRWFKGALTGQARIADRRSLRSEDQYGIVAQHRLEFDLEIDGPLIADANGQLVTAIVSRRIHKRYAEGDVVQLFLSAEDPLEFFVKGE
jgi:hypothetical protein